MTKNPVPAVAQEMQIKALLAARRPRENMSTLARNLGEPYGSVAGNVYGYRRNPALQAKIAAYLGVPAEQLFGGNGGEPAGGPPAPEPGPEPPAPP